MKSLSMGCVLALAALAAGGCVSKGRYDDAVAQTKTTRAELDRKNVEVDKLSLDLGFRRAEIAKLRSELDQLSKSSEHVRTASGARIANLQKRLGELEAAQAAAEARAALYRELSLRLKRQIDEGDLAIVIRDGRMVLQLPNDVLFDTGRTELKPAGKKALEAIAGVMRIMPQRAFQVAGHTDNVPIHNDRFASNWELSSGRALGVVHFLVDGGVHPSMLSAAGYGEVDPVSTNETLEGKRKNRRTEITLQPNIDELVKVPQ
jgi:chemotaxis protein MotB